MPRVRDYNVHAYHQYVIRAQRRSELQAFLKAQGVGTGVYYPLCLHEQECFKPLGLSRGAFPQAERAADEVLALPVYPELTDPQIDYVAAKIREFYGS